MIGNPPQVWNLNRLLLKLNWLAVSSPHSSDASRIASSLQMTHDPRNTAFQIPLD